MNKKYLKVVKDLQKSLDKKSILKHKKWHENYLKHSIPYRGVRLPKIYNIVALWRERNNLDKLDISSQFSICCFLITQEYSEDKMSGIIYLQKYLMQDISQNKLLSKSEKLFKDGSIFNWNIVDWFCVRVLSPLIERDGESAAKKIASWRASSCFWQRRASVVSLRCVVKDKKYHNLIKQNINILVKQPDRFIQTGIGWLISDLSKPYPKVAGQIVEKHFSKLSREVIVRHTKYLPKHKTYLKRKAKKA